MVCQVWSSFLAVLVFLGSWVAGWRTWKPGQERRQTTCVPQAARPSGTQSSGLNIAAILQELMSLLSPRLLFQAFFFYYRIRFAHFLNYFLLLFVKLISTQSLNPIGGCTCSLHNFNSAGTGCTKHWQHNFTKQAQLYLNQFIWNK